MTKGRVVLLSIVVLLGIQAVTATAAMGVEAPYWHVNGKRLGEGESRKATIKNSTGSEVTLNAKINATSVEVKCKTMESHNMELTGSTKFMDALGIGEIELAQCRLIAAGKEQPTCEVPPIKTGTMKLRLWYEGSLAEGGETIVIVFEPKEEKEKHLILAEIAINGCAFAGKYKLENRFATQITPENSESTEGALFTPPSPSEHAHQPQEGGQEIQVQPQLAASPASLKLKATAKLSTGEKFGAFSE